MLKHLLAQHVPLPKHLLHCTHPLGTPRRSAFGFWIPLCGQTLTGDNPHLDSRSLIPMKRVFCSLQKIKQIRIYLSSQALETYFPLDLHLLSFSPASCCLQLPSSSSQYSQLSSQMGEQQLLITVAVLMCQAARYTCVMTASTNRKQAFLPSLGGRIHLEPSSLPTTIFHHTPAIEDP